MFLLDNDGLELQELGSNSAEGTGLRNSTGILVFCPKFRISNNPNVCKYPI